MCLFSSYEDGTTNHLAEQTVSVSREAKRNDDIERFEGIPLDRESMGQSASILTSWRPDFLGIGISCLQYEVERE